MKNGIIVALCFFCVWSSGCKKKESALKDGIITGFDQRKCACCGGLMINFENNTVPYAGNYFLIRQLPANSGITDSGAFPVYVRASASLVPNDPCGYRFVDIGEIEKR